MRALRNILLSVAFLAYALVFGEAFIRLMLPQPLMPRYVTGTEHGIRGNIPNAVYRHRTAEVDVTVRINGQGMRADRDFAETKPPGTCRIALLGDSYFLGYEATLDESIAGQLEAALSGEGFDVEVLNFAVSGFGTAEMLRAFSAQVRRFDPDIAVWQFHSSDFDDNLRAGLYHVTEGGVVVPTGRDYLPGIAIRDRLMQYAAYRWLIGNSHLYTFARERIALRVKQLLAAWPRFSLISSARAAEPEATAPEPRRGVRLTRALVEHSRRVTREAGVDWYLVDIPNRRARDETLSFLPLIGMGGDDPRIVEPGPLLEAHAVTGRLIFRERGHLHLTPDGNRIVARALADRMRAESARRLAGCRSASAEGAAGGFAAGGHMK